MFDARFRMIPQTIVIIGCGGTGSRLVPLVAQFIKTCRWVIDPIIFLIDDDVVEEKNLARQNFILQDVGKPKAEVLATRYSRAFQVPIVPIVKRVDNEFKGKDVNGIVDAIYQSGMVKGNLKASMVISCVDNMSARASILNCFRTVWTQGGIFLDSGNEDLYGQVMVSTPGRICYCPNGKNVGIKYFWGDDYPSMLPVRGKLDYIPLNLDFYEQVRDTGTAGRSCADLDQTMAINCLMANTLFAMVQKIMYSQSFSYHRLNVSLDGTTPEYLTLEYLLSISITDKKYRILNDPYMNVTPADKEGKNLVYMPGANVVTFSDYILYPLKNEYDALLAKKAKEEREARRAQAEKERLERLEEERRKEALRAEAARVAAAAVPAVIPPLVEIETPEPPPLIEIFSDGSTAPVPAPRRSSRRVQPTATATPTTVTAA